MSLQLRIANTKLRTRAHHDSVMTDVILLEATNTMLTTNMPLAIIEDFPSKIEEAGDKRA